MDSLKKISGIYALVSAFAIVGVWLVILALGIIREDWLAHPAQYGFLLGAEALTAMLLATSAVGLFRGSEKAYRLFFLAMGMLFYAVVFGIGKFLSLGVVGLACFFGVVSVATGVLLLIHFLRK